MGHEPDSFHKTQTRRASLTNQSHIGLLNTVYMAGYLKEQQLSTFYENLLLCARFL